MSAFMQKTGTAAEIFSDPSLERAKRVISTPTYRGRASTKDLMSVLRRLTIAFAVDLVVLTP